MFKNFPRLKSSKFYLGITTVFYTIGGLSSPLLAQDKIDFLPEDLLSNPVAKAQINERSLFLFDNSLLNSGQMQTFSLESLEIQDPLISGNSAQFLLTQDVDWAVFCEKFPQNSMCQGEREKPQESDSQSPAIEPPAIEPPAMEVPEIKPPEMQIPQSEPPGIEIPEKPSSGSSSEDSNNQEKPRKWGPLNELSGVAIEPQVSSLGLGLDITARVSEILNARAGFGIFSLSGDYEETDVKYSTDINLRSGAAVMDIYPLPETEFRLSAGVMLNGNKAEATAESQTVVVGGVDRQVYTIGGRTFTAEQVGTLSGDVTFPLVAPFVGIGWGNAVKPGRRLGFTIDLGVMIHGTPEVSLRATNQAVTPQLQESIDKEIEDLNAKLDGFKFYPVLQIGISYQF
ncbi:MULTISPECIES: hypothetical protein [Planktothricoides]|uniref:Outer membrane protein beta-barrel domain-containing protein n=2 Tax=Planktothricoides raciborskii TaxID=132608 RepID=A0AAU8JJI2_9CYAN|nr:MULTISPECIES: hypothetical protein [Planktothricoides]MBD2543758.1 hypothetical protein [Planktothricoides raciborskii FACHB-1370]